MIFFSFKQECVLEQQHLNLVVSVIKRLQRITGCHRERHNVSSLNSASSDKLSIVMQYLLNCLLTLALPPPNVQVKNFSIYLVNHLSLRYTLQKWKSKLTLVVFNRLPLISCFIKFFNFINLLSKVWPEHFIFRTKHFTGA